MSGEIAGKDNNVKENSEIQSQDMITRLFDQMEVFTNRFAISEMQL